MSRPKFYWFGIVKREIMTPATQKNPHSKQTKLYNKAIQDACGQTLQMDRGADRIKAVELILIKQTHTYAGASMELHYSERLIQRWISDFIYLVGKKVGY